jgi:hypothetical protein
VATEIPLPRWTVPVFLAFAVGLVPWIIWLGLSLPSEHTDHFYDVTWVGFDVFELCSLAAVVVLAVRRSAYVEIAATIAATLLVVDAWFDITTSSPGRDRAEAVAAAGVFELPIAFLCAWVARNAEQVRRRTHASLLRRVSRTRRPVERAASTTARR